MTLVFAFSSIFQCLAFSVARLFAVVLLSTLASAFALKLEIGAPSIPVRSDVSVA